MRDRRTRARAASVASGDRFPADRERVPQRGPPPRSLAQREDALRRANAVRAQRAQLKRDLRAGRCAIDELLSDPPAFVQTAKVADLLLAVPKHGPVKVDKLLSRCQIAPAKTVGGLSQRQRDELAELLAGRMPGRDGPIAGS